jgi:hypothetical protein
MPFRLTNISTIFQAIINYILKEYLDIFIIIYLDNILIYSKNLKNYKEYIYKVL